MTRMVSTVTGPVPVEKLGKTLMHEHFLFGYPGFAGDSTLGGFDREQALNLAVTVAERMKSHAVETVVDPTPNDCGRDATFLREVSERTGLHIICATGFYYEGEGAPAYFKMRSAFGDAETEIYEMFMTEITVGIERTGIKPGIIKLGSSHGQITDYEQMFFRAAAKAQKETGVTIVTHTQEGTMGPEQADLLIGEGADANRIVIGHMDGNTDVAYHHQTLSRGVTIAFDRFGLQVIAGCPMDYLRETVLIGLIGMGFANRIVLSHDTVNCWCGRPIKMTEQAQALMASWHPTHLFDDVIPVLQSGGVTDEQLHTMFVSNPQRVFGGHT